MRGRKRCLQFNNSPTLFLDQNRDYANIVTRWRDGKLLTLGQKANYFRYFTLHSNEYETQTRTCRKLGLDKNPDPTLGLKQKYFTKLLIKMVSLFRVMLCNLGSRGLGEQSFVSTTRFCNVGKMGNLKGNIMLSQ